MCNVCKSPNVMAKGMCSACYMRDRRNKKRGYSVNRRKTGQNEKMLLPHMQDWSQRFYKYIDKVEGDCHEWIGAKTKAGYGVFTFADISVLSHRLIYRVNGGGEAEVVMHTCDNPSCCNPSHLIGGTYVQNMKDMDAKGRRVVSKANHLRDRQKHPRAKSVKTPFGEFASASLAADKIKMSVRTLQKKCKNKVDGYSYL